MSLSERLAKEAPSKRVTFAEWLISLEPSDREAFEEACHPRSGYSNAQLLRVIADEGGQASKESLTRYRESLR